jgi:hypothetical protein
MKRVLAGLVLVAATATLSGCYYDPGYSYVRPVATTGGGDAYYGTGVTYDSGYYAAPGYYYPSYGYYGYGCCYGPAVSIGIGGWYGGGYYRGGYYRGGYYGHGYYRGGGSNYRGGHGSWSGGHGGWSGHGH